MDKTIILDKNISFDNYANFKKCELGEDRKSITFFMACGEKYEVPIEYFLKWNSHPHYFLVNGRWKGWKDKYNQYINLSEVEFIKCRRTLLNTAIRVYLSNGTVYIIPWDTVLMACEKRYEHFGGLTDESKRIVAEWHSRERMADRVK